MAAPSEKEFMEKLVTEFFAKSIHTILDSRSPSSSSPSSSSRTREDWFNLQLRGQPAELEKIKQWRGSKAEIMVVDVVLKRKQRHHQHEKVVERWSIQHEIREAVCAIDVAAVSGKVYKKLIIVLRSLYATARMLPAYKLFRELSSSSRCGVVLSLRVSPFMEPFTREEEAEMERFSFNPVDTPFGRLSLFVSYLSTLEDVSLEPPPPMDTEFIPDYVGSPATDPFKIFNSLPSSRHPCIRAPSQNDLFRTESAPVRSHGLPPSPSVAKAQGNKELLRIGGFQIGIALQKALSLGMDGVGKLHRLKIPSCSLVKNFSSRNYSKFSVLNDVPDIDCPFALEVKEDIDVSSKRIEPLDGRGLDRPLTIRKSEDASIGTLLQMLKTAAPLNKDLSNSIMRSSQPLKDETRSRRVEQNNDVFDRAMKLDNPRSTTSRIFKSRTTADALEELQNFKEIKNLLLRQGGRRILNITHSPGSTTMN